MQPEGTFLFNTGQKHTTKQQHLRFAIRHSAAPAQRKSLIPQLFGVEAKNKSSV